MTPVSLNSLGPTLQDQSQLFIFANNQQSTSLSCCTFLHILDQTQITSRGSKQADQQDAGKLVLYDGGSSNNQVYNSSSDQLQPESVIADPSGTRDQHNFSFYEFEDEKNKRVYEYERWISSNVRLTRKMMNPPSSDNKALDITRVCLDCKTTSTPLWRSGPNGPKTLCNACGIRQRKARRAMEEAANNGFAPSMNASSTKTRVHHKEKKQSRTNHFARFKNKCKARTAAAAGGGATQKEKVKIDLKNFAISLRDSSTLKQMFPTDEVTEAALLLMDLSCGFVYFK